MFSGCKFSAGFQSVSSNNLPNGTLADAVSVFNSNVLTSEGYERLIIDEKEIKSTSKIFICSSIIQRIFEEANDGIEDIQLFQRRLGSFSGYLRTFFESLQVSIDICGDWESPQSHREGR